MSLVKSGQKKIITFSKGKNAKLNQNAKDNEQSFDYTHFQKTHFQNAQLNDDWLKREINIQRYPSNEKADLDKTMDDDIMQLKKHQQTKNKTRNDYKKEKWESAELSFRDKSSLSKQQTEQKKDKVFYNDELDLLESEGCKDLSQSLRRTYVSIKQNTADIPRINSSIKHFARHVTMCPHCSNSLENKNLNEDHKTDDKESEPLRANAFKQEFDEDNDSEVETELTSSSKAWIFNKDHSDSD